MSVVLRGLVYVLITAIVLSVLWFTQPRQLNVPYGIFLATTANKAQGPSAIGNISVMMLVNKKINPTIQQKQLIDYALALATAQGGHKIQIQYFVTTASPDSGAPIYLLKAQAV